MRCHFCDLPIFKGEEYELHQIEEDGAFDKACMHCVDVLGLNEGK